MVSERKFIDQIRGQQQKMDDKDVYKYKHIHVYILKIFTCIHIYIFIVYKIYLI